MIFRQLRQTMSLNSLTKSSPCGQVATLLILVLVAILIFIVTTVNLGKVSLTATIVANATDAALLNLASRLSSRAYDLYYENLQGKIEHCQTSGALAIVLSILTAIVLSLIPGMQWYWVVVGTTIAGTVGGAIVHESWAGAAQGARIGFMIGTAFAVPQIPSATGKVSAAVAAKVTVTEALFIGLYSAGELYFQINAYNEAAAWMSETMRRIANIPDNYTMMRELTFYDVLSRVVDDPETVPDAADIDNDGDTTERIPRFTYYYHTEHLPKVKVTPSMDEIAKFQDDLRNNYTGQGSPLRSFLRWLNRKEIECDHDSDCATLCNCNDPPSFTCSEGGLNELLRAYFRDYRCRQYLNPYFELPFNCDYRGCYFWEAGPSKADYLDWLNCSANDCATKPGWDEVDKVHSDLEQILVWAISVAGTPGEEFNGQSARDLDRNHDWIDVFYPPDDSINDTNYYSTWSLLRHWIVGWKNPTVYPHNDYESLPSHDAKGALGRWEWYLYKSRNLTPKCQIAYGDFRPDVSVEDYEYPCGKKYHPGYNSLSGTDKENYAPYYPCTWKKYYSDNTGKTGIYITNPICKSDSSHQGRLNDELSRARNALMGLNETILGVEAKWLGDACTKAHCPTDEEGNLICANNCSCDVIYDEETDDNKDIPPSITFTKMSLTNRGKKGRCSSGSDNTIDSVLNLEYYINYVCRECYDVIDEGGNTVRECIDHHRRYPESEEEMADYELKLYRVRNIVSIPEFSFPNSFDKELPEIFIHIIENWFRPFVNKWMGGNYGTIDEDGNDEYGPVMQKLVEAKQALYNLMIKIENFHNTIKRLDEDRPKNGYGKMSYEWSDSAGTHKVTVEVGPFLIPRIETSTKCLFTSKERAFWCFLKKKVCGKLKDYCENKFGCPVDAWKSQRGHGDYTFVRAIREDSSNIPVSSKKNILGIWNPYATSDGKIKIQREAVASFDYNGLHIIRRKVNKW